MEKIRLKNGQEFELVPMGIDIRESLKTFKIVTTLTQEEIISAFSVDNIASVEYILIDGTVTETYLDCVALKGLGLTLDYQVDESTAKDIYTVIISTDATERALNQMKENVTYTEIALVELYETILGGMI